MLVGSRNRKVAPKAEFTIDEKGHFKLSLPPGEYCVVTANRGRFHVEPGARPGPAMYVDWSRPPPHAM